MQQNTKGKCAQDLAVYNHVLYLLKFERRDSFSKKWGSSLIIFIKCENSYMIQRYRHFKLIYS